jgi:hypothetical protein
MLARLIRRCAWSLLTLALALSSAELVVRLTDEDWKLLRPLLYYQGVHLSLHQTSEDVDLLYELKKSTSAVIEGQIFTMNALGFRDRERSAQKPPGVFRIVCLGSSNTYGALVNDSETYPAQLEALLNEGRRGKRRYEVWNAGVSAYTLRQSAASAEKIFMKYAPDLLLIQPHATGRRPFLLGQPVERYFDEDPSLYAENLPYLPFGGSSLDAALLRRVRFYRALVVLYNRRAAGQGDFAHNLSMTALRRLVEQHGRQVPIVMLYNPGSRTAALPELGLKAIFLDDYLPPDYSADHLLIHPPAYVYRWYAEVLKRALPLPRGL